jgi:hypothetical protein
MNSAVIDANFALRAILSGRGEFESLILFQVKTIPPSE